MYELRVGGPFLPGITHYDEGAKYSYANGGHSLALFMNRPTPQEIAGVSAKSRKQFGLFLDRGIIFLLYRMENIPWGDAPFSWHIVPEDMRVVPPSLAPSEGVLMTTQLVDAATGIIRAINVCSLSHEFSQTLHQAIRDQMVQPFDRRQYDRDLAGVYTQHPDTRSMVDKAIVRCVGGLPPADQSDTKQ